ncbi:hypothetical protein [Labrys sp. 22185]|uniref:hypothetical protein n=1 Tax=Labrys sp. 22185 TaxID=3453888 RepID=UPI003F864DE2
MTHDITLEHHIEELRAEYNACCELAEREAIWNALRQARSALAANEAKGYLSAFLAPADKAPAAALPFRVLGDRHTSRLFLFLRHKAHKGASSACMVLAKAKAAASPFPLPLSGAFPDGVASACKYGSEDDTIIKVIDPFARPRGPRASPSNAGALCPECPNLSASAKWSGRLDE